VRGWRDSAYAKTVITLAQQRYIDNKTTPVVHAPKT